MAEVVGAQGTWSDQLAITFCKERAYKATLDQRKTVREDMYADIVNYGMYASSMCRVPSKAGWLFCRL